MIKKILNTIIQIIIFFSCSFKSYGSVAALYDLFARIESRSGGIDGLKQSFQELDEMISHKILKAPSGSFWSCFLDDQSYQNALLEINQDHLKSMYTKKSVTTNKKNTRLDKSKLVDLIEFFAKDIKNDQIIEKVLERTLLEDINDRENLNGVILCEFKSRGVSLALANKGVSYQKYDLSCKTPLGRQLIYSGHSPGKVSGAGGIHLTLIGSSWGRPGNFFAPSDQLNYPLREKIDFSLVNDQDNRFKISMDGTDFYSDPNKVSKVTRIGRGIARVKEISSELDLDKPVKLDLSFFIKLLKDKS